MLHLRYGVPVLACVIALGGCSSSSSSPGGDADAATGSDASSGSSSGGSSGSSSGGSSGGSSGSGSGGGSGAGSGSGSGGVDGGSGSGSGSSSGGGSGGATCSSPAGCSSSDVCCGTIPVTGGSVPNCNTGSIQIACAAGTGCKTNLRSLFSCSGTKTVRLCTKNADCTESGFTNCCTFSGGSDAGSLSFCANPTVGLAGGGMCQ